MIHRLRIWWQSRFSPQARRANDPLRKTGVHAAIRRKKATEDEAIEKATPDEDSLIRNKFVREDTGTHETLKILDDSIVDSGEEPGIDPYNTGGFDRSKNWNNRFRK